MCELSISRGAESDEPVCRVTVTFGGSTTSVELERWMLSSVGMSVKNVDFDGPETNVLLDEMTSVLNVSGGVSVR